MCHDKGHTGHRQFEATPTVAAAAILWAATPAYSGETDATVAAQEDLLGWRHTATMVVRARFELARSGQDECNGLRNTRAHVACDNLRTAQFHLGAGHTARCIPLSENAIVRVLRAEELQTCPDFQSMSPSDRSECWAVLL
jgi:hypothetical protein